MKKQIEAYIRKWHMVEVGERILVGFSGGADSLALLLCLKEMEEMLGIRVSALHVHHGLRGEEADADAAFAAKCCEKHGIPFLEERCEVGAYAKAHHLGEEEAGRILRREIWERKIREGCADKIALAHHMNDKAETFLFHAARGSSLEGLGSIRPVKGNIIRPFLCITRREIETWLLARGEGWCTDGTNLEDVHDRNKIRHKVIPVLEQEINGGALSHMAQAAEDIAEADDFLRKLSKKLRGKCVFDMASGGVQLSEKLMREESILRRYLIMNELRKVSGAAKDLERKHVELIQELFTKQSGRRIDLPYGIVCERNYEGVYMYRKDAGETVQPVPADEEKNETLPDEIPFMEEGIISLGNLRVESKIMPYNGEKIADLKYTKWFDYDKIYNADLKWRTRRSGDYMVINGEGSKQKIKRYFIDQKIPKAERENMYMLTCGSEVYWVVGYRISEACRVTADTRRVLRVHVIEGND